MRTTWQRITANWAGTAAILVGLGFAGFGVLGLIADRTVNCGYGTMQSNETCVWVSGPARGTERSYDEMSTENRRDTYFIAGAGTLLALYGAWTFRPKKAAPPGPPAPTTPPGPPTSTL